MNDSLRPGMKLEAEMSGLRSQLTSLRAASIDLSVDLLAVLAPMPTQRATGIAPVMPLEPI